MKLLHNQKNQEIYRGFIFNDVHAACEKIRMIMDIMKHTVDISSEEFFEVRVILSELLQNAIKHGSTGENRKVYMSVWVNGEGVLNIKIRDHGEGFNIYETLQEEQKRMRSNTPDLSECGRGLQIVKSLCDDIVLNCGGNCITVKKKLS